MGYGLPIISDEDEHSRQDNSLSGRLRIDRLSRLALSRRRKEGHRSSSSRDHSRSIGRMEEGTTGLVGFDRSGSSSRKDSLGSGDNPAWAWAWAWGIWRRPFNPP